MTDGQRAATGGGPASIAIHAHGVEPEPGRRNASERLRSISAEEFVRRLQAFTSDPDKKYSFFLGAGCSVSSGIPAAGTLVRENWLPRLRDLRAPAALDVNQWAREHFPSYDAGAPARIYGQVMSELFPHPGDRQREIETLCEGKAPSFGYSVLARMMVQEGGQFNVVLTTNFDDLVADALYVFTESRPLLIHHHSLASFIRPTRTRPLVVKLHGDLRLAPLNLSEETESLQHETESQLKSLLYDRGLIVIGYGGADRDILAMLQALPREALPFGVYWVSGQEPEPPIRDWLVTRRAVWVKNSDFDELMFLVEREFALSEPETSRFSQAIQSYSAAVTRLEGLHPARTTKSRKPRGGRRPSESRNLEWVELAKAARVIAEKSPEEAKRLYVDALHRAPHSPRLLLEYAQFLLERMGDEHSFERLLLRVLEIERKNPRILRDVASQLYGELHRDEEAEKIYQWLTEADAETGATWNNYGLFLMTTKTDDASKQRAEELFLRAIEVNPNSARALANYANFLTYIRGDLSRADEYFRRSLSAEPADIRVEVYYAAFLCLRGEIDEGLRRIRANVRNPQPRDALTADALRHFILYLYGDEVERAAARERLAVLRLGRRRSAFPSMYNIHANSNGARVYASPEERQQVVEGLERMGRNRNT